MHEGANLKSNHATFAVRATREQHVPHPKSNNDKAWDRLYALLNFVALPVVALLAVLWLNAH